MQSSSGRFLLQLLVVHFWLCLLQALKQEVVLHGDSEELLLPIAVVQTLDGPRGHSSWPLDWPCHSSGDVLNHLEVLKGRLRGRAFFCEVIPAEELQVGLRRRWSVVDRALHLLQLVPMPEHHLAMFYVCDDRVPVGNICPSVCALHVVLHRGCGLRFCVVAKVLCPLLSNAAADSIPPLSALRRLVHVVGFFLDDRVLQKQLGALCKVACSAHSRTDGCRGVRVTGEDQAWSIRRRAPHVESDPACA
mmetsp:Transcript_13917/g.34377  ORF Transcript_13917/g.34377 Transcript_13917/m.34377 type:complete len:248 (-) Transcript_13917:258-1001(-)